MQSNKIGRGLRQANIYHYMYWYQIEYISRSTGHNTVIVWFGNPFSASIHNDVAGYETIITRLAHNNASATRPYDFPRDF